jgi:hypothetical protein
MLTLFFQALVKLWLPNDRHSHLVNEALAMLNWSRGLKLACWLPQVKTKQIYSWRVKQVKKHVNKIPKLSPAFWMAIEEINECPETFSKIDWRLIQEKRERLLPLISWLKTINSDEDLEKLRAILIESPPIRADWKLKRNIRKQL